MQVLPKKLKTFAPRFFARVRGIFRISPRVHRKQLPIIDPATLPRCACSCGCDYCFAMHDYGYDVELPDGTRVCLTCYIVCLWNDLDVLPLTPPDQW